MHWRGPHLQFGLQRSLQNGTQMLGLLTNGTVKSSTCVHKALIRWDQSTPGFGTVALGWVSRAPAPNPVPPRKKPSKARGLQGFVAFCPLTNDSVKDTLQTIWLVRGGLNIENEFPIIDLYRCRPMVCRAS